MTKTIFSTVILFIFFITIGLVSCDKTVDNSNKAVATDSMLIKQNDSLVKLVKQLTKTEVDSTSNMVLDSIRSFYTFLINKKDKRLIWQQGSSIGTHMIQIDNTLYEYYVQPKDSFNHSMIWFRTENALSKDGYPRERCSFEYHYGDSSFVIENRIYTLAGQGEAVNDVLLKNQRLIYFLNKVKEINKKI